MGANMMNGWGWAMMAAGAVVWLLLVVLLVLAIVALAKYIFSRRQRD
ncbi:MAG TPA: hypothetical protein VJ770_22570 [Stellaceae bacterium]|nr:hypothetical protein [Stellaceae bacterium]